MREKPHPEAPASPPPSAEHALFSPLIPGHVHKNFQDRAGPGRPLSDPLFQPQVLRASQASAQMAGVRTSQRGRCAFSSASAKRMGTRESKSPSVSSSGAKPPASWALRVGGGVAGRTGDPWAFRTLPFSPVRGLRAAPHPRSRSPAVPTTAGCLTYVWAPQGPGSWNLPRRKERPPPGLPPACTMRTDPPSRLPPAIV